jgi:arylsulfatase A-like enzyme
MKKKWLLPFIGGSISAAVILVLIFLFSPDFLDIGGKRQIHPPDAVFLIVVDTLRADRLSCYGYTSHSTPNIDRLASLGVMFRKAQSTASWTRPAVGAIMTSHYPGQLGLVERPAKARQTFKVRERRPQLNHVLPPFKPTLAELLCDDGFYTAAFVNQPALNCGCGFERSFIDFYYPAAAGKIHRYDGKHSSVRQEWSSTKDALENDRALVQKFEQWLGTRAREKIFVWIHLLTPHLPYLPPYKYCRLNSGGGRRQLSARYNGEILATDEMVGRIVDAIERQVGLKRSLLIFTSDHGEEFWEHGSHEHGHSLYSEVIHVPLIMVSPRFNAGTIVTRYVGIIDIMPTIIEAAGLKSRPNGKFEGTSLVPAISGQSTALPVYSEGMLYGNTRRSLIMDDFKLIYDKQLKQWSLYNVKVDPGERIDLSKKLPERTQSLRNHLNKLYSRLKREFKYLRQKHSGQEDEAARRRARKSLESLGYINIKK